MVALSLILHLSSLAANLGFDSAPASDANPAFALAQGFGGGPGFGPTGFSFMSNLFPYLFVIVFLLVIGGLLFRGARYLKNASSPRQSVFVKVVAKRMRVDHHNSPGPANNAFPQGAGHSQTHYYVTLEYGNGERIEYLDVKGIYGLVAEGDTGYAAIQGDWIVAFERAERSMNS